MGVVGLVALGTLLRAAGIADHPLWVDEYGTWWAVAGEGWGEVWERTLAVHGQSPLYYLGVRASLEALGPGTLALRLPSLVCGVALLLLAAPLARAAFPDRRVVLAALAAFAANERLVFYSQEARPYALALLLAAASFLLYLRLLRDPRAPAVRLGYLLATAGAFYAHYLFGVVAAVQALHLGLGRPWRRGALRPWLGTGAGLALLAVPGALHLARLFARRHDLDWVPPAGLAGALEIATGYLEPPVLAVTAGATALAALRGRGLAPLPAGSRPGLVALWAALPFLALGALPALLGVSLLHRRFLVVAVPALALLYGVLISRAPARTRLAWLPLAAFLIAGVGMRLVPHYEQTGHFSRRYADEHWARAAEALRRAHRPGEPIFYATGFVELDALVRDGGPPVLADFTSWPVAAHLSARLRSQLRPLPYTERGPMAPALRQRLEEAAGSPRAWVIGKPPVVPRIVELAGRHPALEVARHRRFGEVQLLRVRRTPDEHTPGTDRSQDHSSPTRNHWSFPASGGGGAPGRASSSRWRPGGRIGS